MTKSSVEYMPWALAPIYIFAIEHKDGSVQWDVAFDVDEHNHIIWHYEYDVASIRVYKNPDG